MTTPPVPGRRVADLGDFGVIDLLARYGGIVGYGGVLSRLAECAA